MLHFGLDAEEQFLQEGRVMGLVGGGCWEGKERGKSCDMRDGGWARCLPD